ncbi:MAM and LDL-receptor class A domain-containing protein 1-like [Pecten maximus]|uniref:MAM and LDL-receptor class A domain-containing protein 1-like n=1 Tax=Pecten maximus TaxID=6579 RepID=UPI001458A429|nr:MAM and LDL-receptor class A domain-containing protein 1-like [Pecten maximus]
MWTLSGNQGNSWNGAQFPVTTSQGFRILIEAVVKGTVTGDAALDDLSFTNGVCGWAPTKASPPNLTTPPTTPATTPATTLNPPITSCNFESGICGWTQSHNDQFDWTRQKGRTATSNTGPVSDHTTGHGYYMFIEASSPRRNGDKARLVSPPITGHGQMCLNFWYHMFGANINSLSVYLLRSASLGTAVWTKQGTQGNAWKQAQVPVTVQGQFSVVMEASRGVSYLGDIAIDDVSLTTGSCSGSTNANSCNFEDPNLCGYTQDTTDDFDWTRQSGQTASANTGPSADHTFGTPYGHYIFIESSNPRRPNNKARIISPMYSATSTAQCVQFYYHMYGSQIGSLNLKLKVQNAIGNAFWTKSGNQGNKWNVAQVTLDASRLSLPYQLVFEGVRGSGYLSDIALDDIQIRSGPCVSQGACNFEKGLCTWTNAHTGDNFDWRRSSGSTTSGGTGPSTDHTLGTSIGQFGS